MGNCFDGHWLIVKKQNISALKNSLIYARATKNEILEKKTMMRNVDGENIVKIASLTEKNSAERQED